MAVTILLKNTKPETDFLTNYLNYTDGTEPHKIYQRWSAIVGIGAILGRNSYIRFGHGKLFPNFYCMLLGEPGARKSTAIKLVKKLISSAGYDTFAADRSSREKFLLDLGGDSEEEEYSSYREGKQLASRVRRSNGTDITELNLWGSSTSSKDNATYGEKEPREVFIVADEFNDFCSPGDVNFFTTLNTLWDFDDDNRDYMDKVKNSKSVSIYQPTVSLLGGNTQENFARAFPPDLLGHGLLSRLLLIHGVPSGREISRPLPPPEENTAAIISGFSKVQREASSRGGRGGELLVEETAWSLLDRIYSFQKRNGISDPRFKGYNQRAYTHLLKLCIIVAASFSSPTVTEEIVIIANTYLHAIERNMPNAIGEFGKGKFSDVSNQILSVLQAAHAPVTAIQLWKSGLNKNLDKMGQLSELLYNLQQADKIQVVALGKKTGFLPKKEVGGSSGMEFVRLELLSDEEREML